MSETCPWGHPWGNWALYIERRERSTGWRRTCAHGHWEWRPMLDWQKELRSRA